MNYLLKKINLTLIICLFIAIPCQGQSGNGKLLPVPKIAYGNALLSGKISPEILKDFGINDEMDLGILIPIFGEKEYKMPIHEDGTFSMKIPLICETYGFLVSGDFRVGFGVAPGKETTLHVTRDDTGKINMTDVNPLNYASEEITETFEFFFREIAHFVGRKGRPGITLDTYKDILSDNHKQLLSHIESSSLTDAGKLINSYLTSSYYLTFFLDYREAFHALYVRSLEELKKTSDELPFSEPKVDKSYYTFLRGFDLNNPYYLYSLRYPEFIELLLADPVLNIPPLGELPVKAWLVEVKDILQDVLGFDKGLFYDVLVASAYERCLKFRHPFTKIQKQNITDYFTNKAYAQFLFAENEDLLAVIKRDSVKKIMINEVPNVPKEEILSKIIERYKGKVVFVDFWATWCGPCLHSFKESEPAKEVLKGKDVVYVYITNVSSPEDKWKVKIQELEGEHYRLTGESWEYITDQLDFSGIPTYAIYDKEGVLKHKQTMFMGKEKMIEWIKELL